MESLFGSLAVSIRCSRKLLKMPLHLATVTYVRHAEMEKARMIASGLARNGYTPAIRPGPRAGVSLEDRPQTFLTFSDASDLIGELERRVPVRFKRIRENAVLPAWGSPTAVGLDLHACLDEPVRLTPGQSLLIPSGWAFECPPGTYARIAPRSGMSMKGFMINGGVVDADFRGEVGVLVVYLGVNLSPDVAPGDRIAQLIFENAVLAQPIESVDLTDSVRGNGAWGSTGK